MIPRDFHAGSNGGEETWEQVFFSPLTKATDEQLQHRYIF